MPLVARCPSVDDQGMTTTIRITDPVDLVKVVPYQLGYHPQRSLVLIGLRRKHLGLVQRLDLPTLPRDCAAAAELMVGHLRNDGCTAAVLVVYEDVEGEGAAARQFTMSRLQRERVEIVEDVVVRGDHVYFPDGGGRQDRPEGGVLLPADDHVPAVADYVARGKRPAASRDALDDRLAPEDDALRERVRLASLRLGALRPVRGSRPAAMADWGAFLDVSDDRWFADTVPSAAAVARMCHSLRDLQLRDLISAWLCPGTLGLDAFDDELRALAREHLPAGRAWVVGATGVSAEGVSSDRTGSQTDTVSSGSSGSARGAKRARRGGRRADSARHSNGSAAADDARAEQNDRLVERLCWLARHTPQAHAPAVLTVLASFTWHLGEGTLTRVALDRALALDPGYRLALLIERMLDLAIRPSRVLSSTG